MLEDRVRTYADANANSDKKEEHTTIKEEGIKSEKSSLRPTEM
jgi:hypothetical protein